MATRNLAILIFVLVPAGFCSAVEHDSGVGVRVRIDPSQEAYPLGAPVLFTVTVTTTRTEPIRFLQVLSLPTEIEVYLSGDEEHFRRWTEGLHPLLSIERQTETLAREQPKHYEMRVLYEAQRQSHLAFEKPGRYWVRVRFPLAEMEPPYARSEIESNTVRVEIQEPRGADAEMWRQIRDDDSFLAFIQIGSADKDTVLKAAGLLKSVASTAYDSPIRSALKEYYRSYTLGVTQLDQFEAELLRSVTGIAPPLPQPFPEDKRLDQIITYHFPEATLWEEVFNQISEQSGVKLEADDALGGRRKTSARVTKPLREIMHNMAVHKAEWVPKGDGYFLKPVDDARKPKE